MAPGCICSSVLIADTLEGKVHYFHFVISLFFFYNAAVGLLLFGTLGQEVDKNRFVLSILLSMLSIWLLLSKSVPPLSPRDRDCAS